jgi:hypothetical protein
MKKTKLYLSDFEWRVVINSLNQLRTKLINEGSYTDTVDDLLLKIIRAPTKKVKEQ